VNTCMVRARHFGDLDDPENNVSLLITKRNGQPLRPELGTEPSVYYVE
jgi:Fe-S-cluster-containing dehydrogenase component